MHLKLQFRKIILPLFLIFLSSCEGQKKVNTETYVYKSGDDNGIGKWYMGREIAHVMGFQGINWLERSEREQEENTTALLANMSIKSTDIIADVGAGSGYHVFKMVPKVSEGMIYAVDIQDEMLQALRDKKKATLTDNVTIVKGSEESVNLPENSMDKVLMVDVYHEFNYPKDMMVTLTDALKPNGKLYLIEYRGEDSSVPIKEVHKMTEAQAIKEMNAVGLRLEHNYENLPWQHCMVFVKD